MTITRAKLALLLIVFLFATERQASAYTDPGSGTLIWQILVGGFVGLGFEFRRIKGWFSRFRDKNSANRDSS